MVERRAFETRPAHIALFYFNEQTVVAADDDAAAQDSPGRDWRNILAADRAGISSHLESIPIPAGLLSRLDVCTTRCPARAIG